MLPRSSSARTGNQWSRCREGLGRAVGIHRPRPQPPALPKEHEAIRFRDIQAQPRKIISSPTVRPEDEHVSYNAGYTNVHEYIPWRTITGRQQFFQITPGCTSASS